MKRTRCHYKTMLFSICAVIFYSTAHGQDGALESGVAVQLSLDPLTYTNYYIDVPVGATRLTVTLTQGAGDLDLFLKFGSSLSGISTYQDLVNNSDFNSSAAGTLMNG